VSLRVTDIDRARTYYIETLGFPMLTDSPTLFLFAAGSTAFGVRAADDSTPAGDVFDPHRVGLDHVALACESEDELQRVADALDPDRIAWEFYMV
jgi:glyoxylase I family protein